MTTEPTTPRPRTTVQGYRDPTRDDPRYEGKHVEVLRHDQGLAQEAPFAEGVTQFVFAGSRSEIAVQQLARRWGATELEGYHQRLIESRGAEDAAELYWKVWEGPGDVYVKGYFGDVYGPFEDVDGVIAWFERQEYVVIDRRGEE